MRAFWLGLSLSVIFSVGCTTVQQQRKWSERVVVPPAGAQTSSLQRWEYFCFQEESLGARHVAALANRAGAQGWEMVGAGPGRGYANTVLTWCFKRRLPQSTADTQPNGT